MDNTDEFLSKISIIADLASVISETLDIWGDDVPVVLFSNIEKRFATIFRQIPPKEQALFFLSVEKGITSHNEELRAAVATGLLEALCTASQTSRDVSLWPTIHTLLGPKSRASVDQWLDWQR